MSIINKVRGVLGHPVRFFDIIKKEKGISGVLQYFLMINVLVGGAWTVLLLLAQKLLFSTPVDSIFIIVVALLYVPLIFASLFMNWGVLHVVTLLFGNRSPARQTLKVLVYASTPIAIFAPLGMIPLIGGLGLQVWFFALAGIGFHKTLRLKTWKAVTICLLPLIVMILLLIIFFSIGIKILSLKFIV